MSQFEFAEHTAARLMSRLHSGDTQLETDAQAELKKWLALDPRHATLWQEMQSAEQALAANAPALHQKYSHRAATKKSAPQIWQTLAACLVVCVLGVGSWEAWARWMPIETRELATAIGEHRRFTLADGSEVTLNTNSRVSVHLTRRQRDLVLQGGEAFFAVSHNPDAPFHVQARDMRVTVLGTRFRVLATREQQIVTVESGHVRVEKAGEVTEELTRNQEWQALSGHEPEVRTLSNLDQLLAWRDGRLIFKDQRLLDILIELQRYRPVPIRYQGSNALADFRLSGVFRTDNTDAFFNTLPLATPAKVEKDAAGQLTVR